VNFEILYFSIGAFATSVISGMTGMAGGMLLLAGMAPFFAPAVLIPLHGLVQLASNGSRIVMLRAYIDKKIALWFTIGACLGASVGAPFIQGLPESWFRLCLGLFILIFTWMPKIKNMPQLNRIFFWVGSVAGFLSLFVGAIGPFIAPFFLHSKLDKKSLVANKAYCQGIIHAAKMLAYFWGGFVLSPWLGYIAAMVPAAIFGNWVGKKILFRLPETEFRLILKILISLAALRVLWLAFV